MIGYLKGKVVEQLERSILLDIHDVGYEVYIPERVKESLRPGDPLELYIYTHVREDTLQLFGFPTFRERKAFLMLLSVTGIGPKSALEIMGVDFAMLVHAISIGDTARIQKVPGIGKKTAERLVLDLQDKMLTLLGPEEQGTTLHTQKNEEISSYNDVVDALMSLGYEKKHLEEVLIKVQKEMDLTILSAEEVVKICLRYL